MISKIYDELMKCGQEIVRDYLKEADDRILNERDKNRYRCKGKRKTTVETKLGVVEYERRIYFDNEEKKHVYLLDEKISAQEACFATGQIDFIRCDDFDLDSLLKIYTYRKDKNDEI